MARTAASMHYSLLLKYALQTSSCSKVPVEGKDSSISVLFLIIKVCSASFQLFRGIRKTRTAASVYCSLLLKYALQTSSCPEVSVEARTALSVYCSLLLKYALQASSCSKVPGWQGQQHQCMVLSCESMAAQLCVRKKVYGVCPFSYCPLASFSIIVIKCHL